ncbi:ROK family transcriptional regulator [Actinoplanes sp. M2I2]|uniref:ROK family transcriptional regulator n=1 Tax=Actinoplanes sp. M2I2 TaxID=1734444 RepID=UPI00201FE2F6|nr:ROK family transcriptional regulator [Actinoplanes sp. M2I2]
MDTVKPSQELLRSLTDEHVLRALMRHRLLTRAELSAEIGISKPTAGESVRRLTEAGLVVDTGQRTPGGRGRGRVGSYYSLAPDVGLALAVSVAPEGVVAECLDAYGDLVARVEKPIGRPARPDDVAAALGSAVDAVRELVEARQEAEFLESGGGRDDSPELRGAGVGGDDNVELRGTGAGRDDGLGLLEGGVGRGGGVGLSEGGVGRDDGVGLSEGGVGRDDGVGSRDDGVGLRQRGRLRLNARPRLAVVSAADPVDRHTGRLLQLPDAPFLLGEIDPVAVLAERVGGAVLVDNDVNWAAEAERAATPLDDFAYLYLDEGLGCAVVSDGEVRRGHRGVAGEVAHLITVGPEGRAMPLIEVFGLLGLRHEHSTAVDVDRLLAQRPPEVVTAVGGLIAALAALIDPEVVVIGGRWGTQLIDVIAAEVGRSPRPVPVRAASVSTEPSLTGARADAVHRLRGLITAR